MKYDAKFVFAEVNADMVYWRRERAGGAFKPFNIHRSIIGKFALRQILLIRKVFKHPLLIF